MMMGKILRVNLTTRQITEEPYPEVLARQFMGGAAAAIKLLYDEVDPKVDALGPENKLIRKPRLPLWNRRAHLQPGGLCGQVAPVGHSGLCQLRGLFPQRTPSDRCASHHRGGQGRGPGVPLDHR